MRRSGLSLALFALVGCAQPTPLPQSNEATLDERSDRPSVLNPPPTDARGEFLRAANGDDWARPPPAWPDAESQPCTRVVEAYREEAIRRLRDQSAVRLTRDEYRRLTGSAEAHRGSAYLLRGFATNNSVAQLTISGADVIVSSDALGGIFNLRRHPCAAFLERPAARVFTWAAYDM